MRSFKLARVAAQAELLRLRRLVRRQVVRAVLGAIALTFLLICLAALHFAGYFGLLRAGIAPVWATLIVAGVDLLIGLIFLIAAASDTPDKVEREALQVREAAQRQLMETAAASAVVGPLLRSLGARKVYGLVLAALTARFLGAARR
ncbi:MAG TPA: hypothetical protein VFN46_08285 [Acetobacteraceae bacterium]|nr:hypothetical protein [Acetobacteraceae bacterium]